MLEGNIDLAMCGYGRSPQELRDTQQCFHKTGLVLGELLFPFDYVQRTAPQALQAATLLRRCCDATRGCLIYHYPTLDGRSFLAIAEVSRLLARYEPFFTSGIRSPARLKMHTHGVKSAEFEVLEDGQGNLLVVLMNLQDKPRQFDFEVYAPPGMQLLDEQGHEVGSRISPTVGAFHFKVFELRISPKESQL